VASLAEAGLTSVERAMGFAPAPGSLREVDQPLSMWLSISTP